MRIRRTAASAHYCRRRRRLQCNRDNRIDAAATAPPDNYSCVPLHRSATISHKPRPPILIQIAAGFSPRLTRYTRDYGIYHTGVSEIKTGKTWLHVTAPLTDKRQRGGHIKLTRRDVELIRQDSRSLAVIAREYGVGRTTIWYVKHRVTWNHIP